VPTFKNVNWKLRLNLRKPPTITGLAQRGKDSLVAVVELTDGVGDKGAPMSKHFPFGEAAMCVHCGTVFAREETRRAGPRATRSNSQWLKQCHRIIPMTRLYCDNRNQCKTKWWNTFRFHKRTY
jgi:hypothetical protein